jgi:phosphonoacetate hydrolase
MKLIRASGDTRESRQALTDQLPDPHTSPFNVDPAHLEDPYFSWGVQVDDLGLQQIRQLWADPATAPRLTWWANVVTDAGHHGGRSALGDGAGVVAPSPTPGWSPSSIILKPSAPWRR